jgi:hypothetical protein
VLGKTGMARLARGTGSGITHSSPDWRSGLEAALTPAGARPETGPHCRVSEHLGASSACMPQQRLRPEHGRAHFIGSNCRQLRPARRSSAPRPAGAARLEQMLPRDHLTWLGRLRAAFPVPMRQLSVVVARPRGSHVEVSHPQVRISSIKALSAVDGRLQLEWYRKTLFSVGGCARPLRPQPLLRHAGRTRP